MRRRLHVRVAIPSRATRRGCGSSARWRRPPRPRRRRRSKDTFATRSRGKPRADFFTVRERFVRVRVRVDSNRGRVGGRDGRRARRVGRRRRRRRANGVSRRARDGAEIAEIVDVAPSLGFGIVRIVGGGVRGVVDARVGGVGGRGRRRRRRARERRDVRGGVPRGASRARFDRARVDGDFYARELLPAATTLAATALGREAADADADEDRVALARLLRRLRRRRADWRGGATETAFFRAAIEPFASDPNLDAKTTRRLARLAPLTLPADPTASAAFVRACAKRAGDAIAKRDGPIAGAPLLLYAACFASEARGVGRSGRARERGRHGTRRARVGDGRGDRIARDVSETGKTRDGGGGGEGGRRALRKRGRWWWWCSFRLRGGGGGVRARRGGVGRRGD